MHNVCNLNEKCLSIQYIIYVNVTLVKAATIYFIIVSYEKRMVYVVEKKKVNENKEETKKVRAFNFISHDILWLSFTPYHEIY